MLFAYQTDSAAADSSVQQLHCVRRLSQLTIKPIRPAHLCLIRAHSIHAPVILQVLTDPSSQCDSSFTLLSVHRGVSNHPPVQVNQIHPTICDCLHPSCYFLYTESDTCSSLRSQLSVSI